MGRLYRENFIPRRDLFPWFATHPFPLLRTCRSRSTNKTRPSNQARLASATCRNPFSPASHQPAAELCMAHSRAASTKLPSALARAVSPVSPLFPPLFAARLARSQRHGAHFLVHSFLPHVLSCLEDSYHKLATPFQLPLPTCMPFPLCWPVRCVGLSWVSSAGGGMGPCHRRIQGRREHRLSRRGGSVMAPGQEPEAPLHPSACSCAVPTTRRCALSSPVIPVLPVLASTSQSHERGKPAVLR